MQTPNPTETAAERTEAERACADRASGRTGIDRTEADRILARYNLNYFDMGMAQCDFDVTDFEIRHGAPVSKEHRRNHEILHPVPLGQFLADIGMKPDEIKVVLAAYERPDGPRPVDPTPQKRHARKS